MISHALLFLRAVSLPDNRIDYSRWAREAVAEGFETVAYLNAKWAAHDARAANPALRGEEER